MADKPPTQACANCRYRQAARLHYNSDGTIAYSDTRPVCKRYPPDVRGLNDNWPYGYPSPQEYQWCGEWSPANPETAEEAATVLARFVLLGDLTAARALADKLRE